MKNILLPTDFSNNAWTAALYAFQLFKQEACTFYFLHSTMLKASTGTSFSSKLSRVMTENAQEDLTELKLKAEAENANPKHSFEIILCTYDLQDAIESVCNRQNVDMVVMGTKGITGALDIVFGTNTIDTIKNLKSCPLLAIPDDFEYEVPTQIAFPTGFIRTYGKTLEPLIALANLHGAHIHVVHINTEDELSEDQQHNLAQLKIALEHHPHTLHWLPDYDKKERGITEFIKASETNILAMINYKQTFIEILLNEPVIKKIGAQLKIPFMVIPG
ncbi:universal stress protein [Bizionia sediminis]|uniref:Universal stress protein n=1 Tax=Bizionia sediminis TaxID=1737064 RepID=A0ABW5KQ65_9FLAO